MSQPSSAFASPAAGPAHSFLASPGVMGRLIAEYDWSRTALGPLDGWPQSLRTSVNLMLNSRHAMWIGWGPDITFLYNDAYIDVLSQAKHPAALGQPASVVWAEIWDFCGPLAYKVFERSEATFVDDVQLFMSRGSYLEETWFSFSYSPINDESGAVGGLFCPSTDATSSNLNRRRLGTLSRLSSLALREDTVSGACAAAASTLGGNPSDLPFALLYLCGADEAVLECAVHLAPGAAPARVALAADGAGAAACGPALADRSDPFGVALAAVNGAALLLDLAGVDGLPRGLADQPVSKGLALPLNLPGRERPAGVLVVGVSPARQLDSEYRTFLGLVAGQVEVAIQNATAAEEQRRHAEQLAELDRVKTAFFSNISHEFRTPLTLMLGPIADALGDPAAPLAPLQQERLQLVQYNAQRLQKLVNALLDFSRVQAGRMQASFAEVDLCALTADLASGFRSVLESAGLALEVHCELDGPVYVDVPMWEKIVLNLMSNAFKFTFEGGISVRLRQEGAMAVLSVSDSGVGIAPADQAAIFERFQRVEGARSRTHEGSGIGLALVRDLVELHQGSITVSSAAGLGSTFTVAIPLGRAHLRDEQLAAPAAATAPDSDAIATYTSEAMRWLPDAARAAAGAEAESSLLAGPAPQLLIADDNADMRGYLTRLLGQRWRISVADNGEQALRMIRAQRPDLVVSDVMMPLLDGFGLIAALRADPELSDVPVVLLSARAGEEARIEGLNAGADDYLVKPFSARELQSRLDGQLVRARMRAVEKAQAERMAAIFRQVPAGIAILRGPRHVFEVANESYLELVGHRNVLGKPMRQAMPELEGQPFFGLLDRVYASGEPYIGQSQRVDLAAADGGAIEERYFDFVYQPLRALAGPVEGVIVVAFEVTELVRARRDAELANRAKDEFLAMLGHELRNPLAPIVIALELMRIKGTAGLAKEHAVIERQAQHLVRLVDDLLDVARIAQGKVVLRPEPVQLAQLAAQAVETVSPLLEEKQHRLRLELPAEPVCMQADPTRFAQVLSNLLTNAAKYTNNGGSIVLRARVEQGMAVIQVIDDGIGIEPEMQALLFDKFVQERQALDRSRGGLGLGLAIVKNIVALHGGTVAVHSDGAGRGSTFEVRVPASVRGGAGEGWCHTAQQAPARHQARAEVLVVDDNPDVLDMLGALLETQGYRVTARSDPAAALKLDDSFAPAIAILDIGLPGMDGYELAQALRQRPAFRDTRLLALSGYGQAEDRVRSLAAGFSGHLVKPVGGAELLAAIGASSSA